MRAVPGLRDPLVTYRLTRRDRALLGRGLARLALLMLEAGADRGLPVVPRRAGRAHAAPTWPRCSATFSVGRASVMTVHLCSTVPLGEDDRARPPTASGSCAARRNVYVNDASLLPDAPGVNPQAR